jgi:hypothetical protein
MEQRFESFTGRQGREWIEPWIESREGRCTRLEDENPWVRRKERRDWRWATRSVGTKSRIRIAEEPILYGTPRQGVDRKPVQEPEKTVFAPPG